MRGRLSFKYNEDDGWQDNEGTGGGDFAITNVKTIRGQLEVDLHDDLSFLFKASHYDSSGTNQNLRIPRHPGCDDIRAVQCCPDQR